MPSFRKPSKLAQAKRVQFVVRRQMIAEVNAARSAASAKSAMRERFHPEYREGAAPKKRVTLRKKIV